MAGSVYFMPGSDENGFKKVPQKGFPQTPVRGGYVDYTQPQGNYYKPQKLTAAQRNYKLKLAAAKTSQPMDNSGFMQIGSKGFPQAPQSRMTGGYVDYSEPLPNKGSIEYYKARNEASSKRLAKSNAMRKEKYAMGMNAYNESEHAKKLQRLSQEKQLRDLNNRNRQKMEMLPFNKTQNKIDDRQARSMYIKLRMQQEQQAFDTSWMGKSVKNAELAAQNVGQFAGVASGGQSFTQEQEALRQMFGHGESMWGFPESHGPDINNDLHPSLNGDTGTADIFGFGGRGQRSGLF
jgi:hypothetical protein